jgi:DNA polymerase III delta prime subunit
MNTDDINTQSVNNMQSNTDIKWVLYKNDIENRIQQMWNFFLYNQFNNEEIQKLTREIRFMMKDLEMYKEKNKNHLDNISKLEKKISSLNGEVSFLKDEIKYYQNKEETSRKRKRSDNTQSVISNIDVDEWYKNQMMERPINYETLKYEKQKELLKEIFENMNTIDDIIKLKDNKNKFDLVLNCKFKKLFRLIPCLEKINEVVGMTDVKETLYKMICYFVHGLNSKQELNHIVITGQPGVGKTTLAFILGQIYKNLGFLKNDKFMTAKRSELIGEYCGHTAVKTQKIMDEAEGGVLFIDEIYSLGNPEKKDVFTKECIDTINQNLTEKGDKLLVIIAGYQEDVEKCFFNYNKGLERRFTIRFDIKAYNYKDLFLILKKFVKNDGFELSNDIDDSFIKKYYEYYKFMGGDMVTLLKYAKENYSLRLMKKTLKINNKFNKRLLLIEDFEKAQERFNNRKIDEKIPKYIQNLYI